MTLNGDKYLDAEKGPLPAWLVPTAIAAISLGAYAWLVFSPQGLIAGEPVALVFPPHWSGNSALLASASLDVDLITVGTFEFVAVVVPRTEQALDDLHSIGALFAMKTTVGPLCTVGKLGN